MWLPIILISHCLLVLVCGSGLLIRSTQDCSVCKTNLGKAKEYINNVLSTLNGLSDLLSIDAISANDQRRPSFYVRLTSYVALGVHQTVIFDNVVTNNRNGYNVHTGIFTAPLDGLYYFSSSFVSKQGYAELQMMKNGEDIGRGLAWPDNGSSGSMNVVINLKTGDVVKIRNARAEVQTLHEIYCSFAGYLV